MPREHRSHVSVAYPSPNLVADRYEVLGEVARGGCGAVYEARDLRLDRLVAIKVLQAGAERAALERFAREARVAASIHHPNVCSVIDSGHLDDGSPFLVMERLQGETLRSYVGRMRRLDAEESIEIAVQMLSGLDAAHEIGIVHRDVKPENVFLARSTGGFPLVKLLDFGMCRAGTSRPVQAPPESEVGDDHTLTRAGAVVGTPEYMAPEQASGKRVFDLRIDIYAVGVILYEALTGTRAFYGPDSRAVLISVLTRPLPAVRTLRPELPVAIDRIVARAIERDPRARYASASEFQHDLLLARTALRRQRAERAEAERRRRAVPSLAPQLSECEMPTRELVRPIRRMA